MATVCAPMTDAAVVLDIRLAPTEGIFNASELTGLPPQRGRDAQCRLETLLTGGPFWVELTGERSFERWVGRVYRQVSVDVATDRGVRFETRVENVADRMKAEGFSVTGGG